MAFLMGVLITFSRLSLDSEVIALKANGFSIYRLALPIFLVACLISALSIALNISWVPWGETAFKKTEIRLSNTKAVSSVKEGTFTSGFFDLLIFADKVDQKTNRLHRVFIFDEREAKNPLTYVSKDAETIPVKTSTEFGSAIMLRLYAGSTHHQNLETHTYEKMDFDTYHLYLKVDEGADTALQKPHMIPQDHLLELIRNHPLNTFEGREFRGEYWRRYCTALTPLIFVLLGVGFGTIQQRTAKTGAALTGAAILISYWALQMTFTSMLQTGQLNPVWAMQLPNIIIFIIGLAAFRKAVW
jgi:lipopolysaccharide export system permease protein